MVVVYLNILVAVEATAIRGCNLQEDKHTISTGIDSLNIFGLSWKKKLAGFDDACRLSRDIYPQLHSTCTNSFSGMHDELG